MLQYSTIEEALEDLRAGKIILVTDDENRENEGDMICAAQFATTENVNFMASHAKGLICMPMSRELCRKLALFPMVTDNTESHETAFTVSIDHTSTTTGISAEERGMTARACCREDRLIFSFLHQHNFRNPIAGIIFPGLKLRKRFNELSKFMISVIPAVKI